MGADDPTDAENWLPIQELDGSKELLKAFVARKLKDNWLPMPGKVGIVTGGPPCQGVRSMFDSLRMNVCVWLMDSALDGHPFPTQTIANRASSRRTIHTVNLLYDA